LQTTFQGICDVSSAAVTPAVKACFLVLLLLQACFSGSETATGTRKYVLMTLFAEWHRQQKGESAHKTFMADFRFALAVSHYPLLARYGGSASSRRDVLALVVALNYTASQQPRGLLDAFYDLDIATGAYLMWQHNRGQISQFPNCKFSLKAPVESLDCSLLYGSLVTQVTALQSRWSPSDFGMDGWPALGTLTSDDLVEAIETAVKAHVVAVCVGREEPGKPVTYAPSGRSLQFSLTNVGLYATGPVRARGFIAPYAGVAKLVLFDRKRDDASRRSFNELAEEAKNQAIFHAEECTRQRLGPENRKCVLLADLQFGGLPLTIYVDGRDVAGVGSFANHADGDSDAVNAKLRPLHFGEDARGVGLGIFADSENITPCSELLISYVERPISFDGDGETWSQGDGWSQGPRPQSCPPDQPTLWAQQARDWLLQLRLLRFPRAEALNPDNATVPCLDTPAFLTALAAARPRPGQLDVQ
jgi:hypothetical protein